MRCLIAVITCLTQQLRVTRTNQLLLQFNLLDQTHQMEVGFQAANPRLRNLHFLSTHGARNLCTALVLRAAVCQQTLLTETMQTVQYLGSLESLATNGALEIMPADRP